MLDKSPSSGFAMFFFRGSQGFDGFSVAQNDRKMFMSVFFGEL